MQGHGFLHALPRDELRLGRGAVNDGRSEAGHPFDVLDKGLQLLDILDHGNAGTAVLHLVCDLLHGVRGVDAAALAPRGHRRQSRDVPLRRVEAVDGHRAIGLQAQAQERGRGCLHLDAVLGPGPAPPLRPGLGEALALHEGLDRPLLPERPLPAAPGHGGVQQLQHRDGWGFRGRAEAMGDEGGLAAPLCKDHPLVVVSGFPRLLLERVRTSGKASGKDLAQQPDHPEGVQRVQQRADRCVLEDVAVHELVVAAAATCRPDPRLPWQEALQGDHAHAIPLLDPAVARPRELIPASVVPVEQAQAARMELAHLLLRIEA
mmetsp:Transcript_107785/g.300448  ORF Transcript_107785/g.300448 Transcript_107785/m.300448 type:complete len:319 (-) Transcript_107785:974-1930(-)